MVVILKLQMLQALSKRAEKVSRFARLEGLEAHARAVDLRLGIEPEGE